MNFLRDRSLKQLGLYLVVLLSLVYLVEYSIVRHKINLLNESERKIDFARATQVANQKIALQVQHYINGKSELAPDIAAALDEQDHLMTVLRDGGRVDGTDRFLLPLSRLPRITFDNLQEHWQKYKSTCLALVAADTAAVELAPPVVVQTAPAPVAEAIVAETDSTVVDSTAVATELAATPAPTPTPQPAIAETSTAPSRHNLIRQESISLTLASWYDKLIIDLEEEVTVRNNAVDAWILTLTVLDILLLCGILFLFHRQVLAPLQTLRDNTANHSHSTVYAENEIGSLAHQINNTIENLRDATEFVTAIGEGNLSMDYQEALDRNYTQGRNKLADSLIDMQVKLRQMNEEERKRQWANEGLAKFVDILRSSNDNIHVLGDKIISTLVQYTKSNQGGLYILNDEDEHNEHLEMVSLFAFDVKKHEQQRIKLGQGILGQTFLEKETTYLTDLPEEYVRITSGLGDASPRSILIVPLKVDREVYGLVELATFHTYAPHEIAFVEKLGETIASTLASVKAAQKNRHLIEQFQAQTEEMRAQEEEMRQNMEELQATQEEVVRKERNYIDRIDALENRVADLSTYESVVNELKEELRQRVAAYEAQIAELKQALEQKPTHGDDWAVAEEVAQTLRINLEALKITQEALSKDKA